MTRLRHSPLAIRWFVLAVEAGRDPLALIRDQSELLEFCVRSVYDDLTGPAQEVLSALAVLGRPVTADELVILLDHNTDAINVGLQELIRGSLVRRDSTGSMDDLALRVRLTDTASQFLAKRISVDRDFAKRVAARESEYRANEERRVADTKSRSLAPIVVRTNGPQDVPTAQILRRALLASHGGNIEAALADVDTAHRLNPDLWEVDRVEAFILASAGQADRALICYERAYDKAQDEGRGVVAHFLAGHLARNLKDVQQAIRYAREAHETLGTNDTAVALGNYLIWNRDFAEGIALIEPVITTSTGKGKLIAVSSLAEGHRRWGEFARDQERNPVIQYRRASKGFEIAMASLEAGVADRKIRTVATDCAATALHGAASAASDGMAIPDLNVTLDRLNRSLVRLADTPAWPRLTAAVQRLTQGSRTSSAAQRLNKQISELENASADSASGDDGRFVGEVANLQPAYGFIRNPVLPSNIFFHSSGMRDPRVFQELAVGALVSFSIVEEERGKRAVDVALH